MRQGCEIQRHRRGFVCGCVIVWTVLTMLLCVHPGGASCQIEGREDPSRPGKNQGGTGQKGRTTSFLFYTLSLTYWLSFSFKKTILTHNNRCPVIFTARCVSLWTSFTARRWSAEKIGHCGVWLCVCVSAGEGARNQEEASDKRALQDNADIFYTKRLIYPIQPKECWFSVNNWGALLHWKPWRVCMSPLGSRYGTPQAGHFYQCFRQWMNCLCEWEQQNGVLFTCNE